MNDHINRTLQYVQFLGRRFGKDDIKSVILLILIDLRIPSGRDGSYYLRRLIERNCLDPSMNCMKDLYQAVAPGVSYSSMEQLLRGVISSGWNNGSAEKWNLYFPADENGKRRKPSNAQFVTEIARIVELWQGASEEVSYEEA